MMELEPGMRVRCVRIGGMTAGQAARASVLTVGQEYVVTQSLGGSIKVRGSYKWWGDWRFKPVVRVKAKSAPVITEGPFRGMTQDDALDLVIGGY